MVVTDFDGELEDSVPEREPDDNGYHILWMKKCRRANYPEPPTWGGQ